MGGVSGDRHSQPARCAPAVPCYTGRPEPRDFMHSSELRAGAPPSSEILARSHYVQCARARQLPDPQASSHRQQQRQGRCRRCCWVQHPGSSQHARGQGGHSHATCCPQHLVKVRGTHQCKESSSAQIGLSRGGCRQAKAGGGVRGGAVMACLHLQVYAGVGPHPQ